jgi:hypothetical protein
MAFTFLWAGVAVTTTPRLSTAAASVAMILRFTAYDRKTHFGKFRKISSRRF